MINLYGFFIALGILVGAFVVEKINNKFSILNSEFSILDTLPWLLIPGIIGARLYHVFDYWQYYSKNSLEILFIWHGGLGIFGGILGGIVGLWIFLKINNKNVKIRDIFLPFLDLGVIGLSIGQVIGRWGNYFNQELYGLPTNLPWAIYIRPENRLAGFDPPAGGSHFHPLFLYESIGCLIIFFVCLGFLLRSTDPAERGKSPRKKPGLTFFLYLFLYSFLRFWLEFLRPIGWQWKGFRVTQLVSLGLIFFSSFAIYKKCVKIRN